MKEEMSTGSMTFDLLTATEKYEELGKENFVMATLLS